MKDKILLTGICHVHRLLQLRFAPSKDNFILGPHPDFNIGNIDFFKEDIAKNFLFTDFHGKYSSIKTEANNLFDLLTIYNQYCRLMYVVGTVGIPSKDVAANLEPKDYIKISTFWYFLFNEEWNPNKMRDWGNKRDKAILYLLKSFPNLKFIFYDLDSKYWWQNMGLPRDRMIFWNVDWGMTEEQYEEIRQDILARGYGGGHRYPTEQSYNELCDIILKDYNNSQSISEDKLLELH